MSPRKMKDLTIGKYPNIPDLNVTPHNSEDEDGFSRILFDLIPDLNVTPHNSEDEDANNGFSRILFDLQVEIFARSSCFEYWKLNFFNKQFSQMLKSCGIFKVRRERGLVQPYVLMLPNNSGTCWSMFDKDFKNHRKLSKVPSDFCFHYGDKETICAGTHLIVIGQENHRNVVWRYELEMHKWVKDTTFTPRVMIGSASHGTEAFFAGGYKPTETGTHTDVVVSEVDKYNADTKRWTKIKGMNKRRVFSSGCFLHGKFYVIGGRDENDVNLTCGESYDEKTDTWTLIPHMLKGMKLSPVQCPPLIAVVNDNLYMFEPWLSEIWVYNVNANVWKKLGNAPVLANFLSGWGVAFKSIGDRLLVIGSALNVETSGTPMSVYTCRPSPNVEELIWEKTKVCGDGAGLSHFIRNCCVMFA